MRIDLLTQIRICTTAKFPIAQAKWRAVLKSLSLTVELTSAAVLCISAVIIERVSDLMNENEIIEWSPK